MANINQPETDPRVRWFHRGGFTTIAMISLVLGAIGLIVIALGAIFGELELAANYVPFPSIVGLLFGILGVLGPWKWTAAIAVVLNIAAMTLAMVLG
ncbi:hypothetical protein [Gulosibacter chungangensis]|uniref:Uncharacterized protein n=1 Tax=Gulosibacter chungangensis TaxID=979746 RepID=A0A7J5BB93_9MICO|nr:hypothetical protein [Gulosibacter chungangensis]KAB1642297.1 hypothetical protein F8O05_10785 [Gulosibacter chungangensis]